MSQDYLLATYRRQDICFTHGEGAWLTASDGRRYLDGVAGIAVSCLGHGHPRLVAAVRAQAGRLLHSSNLYRIPLQEDLARRLCRVASMAAVFFCNSGAEANEAALKLARRHGRKRGSESPKIVVMEGAFHGRTLATLAATGNAAAREGFEPLPQGFVRVPFGECEAVAALADDSDIAAVLVEPIQGEAGVHVAPPGYLAGLRRLCDAHGWLLMLDEVQTGTGRTGAWFAHQQEGITPDVMTLAKGLGGGVPIGAALVNDGARDLLGAGSHGSTFGGNPLACAAGLAVVESIDEDGLLEHSRAMGARLLQAFTLAFADVDAVLDVRGRGLMLGIELDRDAAVLVERARNAGVLINVTAGSVVRLLPPLVLTAQDADQIADAVIRLIRQFCGE